MTPIAVIAWRTTFSLRSASVLAWATMPCARVAPPAERSIELVSSPSAPAEISSAEVCCAVRLARSLVASAISAVPRRMTSVLWAMMRIVSRNVTIVALKSTRIGSRSGGNGLGSSAVRSPCASRSRPAATVRTTAACSSARSFSPCSSARASTFCWKRTSVRAMAPVSLRSSRQGIWTAGVVCGEAIHRGDETAHAPRQAGGNDLRHRIGDEQRDAGEDEVHRQLAVETCDARVEQALEFGIGRAPGGVDLLQERAFGRADVVDLGTVEQLVPTRRQLVRCGMQRVCQVLQRFTRRAGGVVLHRGAERGIGVARRDLEPVDGKGDVDQPLRRAHWLRRRLAERDGRDHHAGQPHGHGIHRVEAVEIGVERQVGAVGDRADQGLARIEPVRQPDRGGIGLRGVGGVECSVGLGIDHQRRIERALLGGADERLPELRQVGAAVILLLREGDVDHRLLVEHRRENDVGDRRQRDHEPQPRRDRQTRIDQFDERHWRMTEADDLG